MRPEASAIDEYTPPATAANIAAPSAGACVEAATVTGRRRTSAYTWSRSVFRSGNPPQAMMESTATPLASKAKTEARPVSAEEEQEMQREMLEDEKTARP